LPSFSTEQLVARHVGPVTLTCAAGECIAIQGASGSGKTLLLRAMADLDPHAGELFLDETSCSSQSAADWRAQVGLVMAESQWWFDKVGEHFPHGVEADWMAQLALPMAALDWDVARCSTGERQRLALLRSLMLKPAVLLLDEPTGNLDAASTARVEALLASYRQSRHAALLWVSHDDQQVARVAQRAFLLRDGLLVERRP
jgi:putative ABC transport system ATP-binding protein